MSAESPSTWKTYAEAYAFLGNSLLKPMTQTLSVGLDPSFWAAFPCFESDEVRQAVDACGCYATGLMDACTEFGLAVQRVSVEYTRLFVGPPKPSAPPWETMYRSENVTVGFGEATFEMRRLLREAGLQLCNDNNQYEDHMGIELLYLSVLCQRVSESVEAGNDGADAAANVRAFISERPALWIDAFVARVDGAASGGYYVCLLKLVKVIMGTHFKRV